MLRIQQFPVCGHADGFFLSANQESTGVMCPAPAVTTLKGVVFTPQSCWFVAESALCRPERQCFLVFYPLVLPFPLLCGVILLLLVLLLSPHPLFLLFLLLLLLLLLFLILPLLFHSLPAFREHVIWCEFPVAALHTPHHAQNSTPRHTTQLSTLASLAHSIEQWQQQPLE